MKFDPWDRLKKMPMNKYSVVSGFIVSALRFFLQQGMTNLRSLKLSIGQHYNTIRMLSS
jgi:hypothetical protein